MVEALAAQLRTETQEPDGGMRFDARSPRPWRSKGAAQALSDAKAAIWRQSGANRPQFMRAAHALGIEARIEGDMDPPF